MPILVIRIKKIWMLYEKMWQVLECETTYHFYKLIVIHINNYFVKNTSDYCIQSSIFFVLLICRSRNFKIKDDYLFWIVLIVWIWTKTKTHFLNSKFTSAFKPLWSLLNQYFKPKLNGLNNKKKISWDKFRHVIFWKRFLSA